jgi:uncharacterized FlgJ-related protein
MNRIAAVLLCVATAVAFTAQTATARTNESIQESCSNQARQSWADDYRYGEHGRARQQVYTNCMMEHGLRP